MKPRTSYLWILFLFAIVLAGCSSTDPMKSTAIRMELDQLEDKLRASNEPEGILTTGAGQDTVFIAGYPEGKIEVEGRSFTVFTLADADYSPGSMGSTYTTFDSRTGAMITHTTPPTNAGIHLGTGDAMFALEEDVPILERRWWIFFKKPHLYYFPAAITGSYVPHEGSGLRILEPAPSPSDAKWSPLLPPRLPDHLVDLKGNALFIARRGYDLGSPFAPVPVNFHIGFDHKNTRALYEKILAGEFGADHPWDEDELTRLNRWLSAYPHYQKAEAFLNDEKTPWIVAMDSPTLLRERRLQAGRESLNNAVEHDPQWSEPKDRLVDVDEEEAGLGVADEGHGPTGKRFRIGLGARAILLSESYSAPYEDVESSVNMSMFGHYQVLNDFSLSLGSEAFQAVFSDGDKPHNSVVTPGQVYLHLNYQTPLRIQMGNTGRRLQLTVGVVRLSDQIELAGETYKGTGTGFDVAVSLVPRKGYYFHGPESKTLNKSGFIQLGYRSGEIDEYRGGSPEAVLAFEDGGALNYKPRGWWLGIDWDFFGF